MVCQFCFFFCNLWFFLLIIFDVFFWQFWQFLAIKTFLEILGIFGNIFLCVDILLILEFGVVLPILRIFGNLWFFMSIVGVFGTAGFFCVNFAHFWPFRALVNMGYRSSSHVHCRVALYGDAKPYLVLASTVLYSGTHYASLTRTTNMSILYLH